MTNCGARFGGFVTVPCASAVSPESVAAPVPVTPSPAVRYLVDLLRKVQREPLRDRERWNFFDRLVVRSAHRDLHVGGGEG
jgi:hypothetical protein